MTPTYVIGDATAPMGSGPRIIAHVCNDIGRWGSGFVVAVSKRWAAPEARYRAWWRKVPDGVLPLGEVQLVDVGRDLWVANMVAQRGVGMARGAVPPIRYEALARCLREVADAAVAVQASVHMPRIGCGLAGGRWDHVEPIVVAELCERDVKVVVYDLPAQRRERK